MIETLSFFGGGRGAEQCQNNEEVEHGSDGINTCVDGRIRHFRTSTKTLSSKVGKPTSILKTIGLLGLLLGVRCQRTDPFPAKLDLANLEGTDGFMIEGLQYYELGNSVSSIGDFNQDGIDDFVVGAWLAYPDMKTQAGMAFILFGTKNFDISKPYDLSNLTASQGLIIKGKKAGDRLGKVVRGDGDFNGDGYNDLFLTAYRHDSCGRNCGQSYVIFNNEKNVNRQVINLEQQGGEDIFTIEGESNRLESGISASYAGDFNKDGFDDLIISSRKNSNASPLQNESIYLVYGHRNSSQSLFELNELNGENGLIFNFDYPSDNTNIIVSDAGDFNNDGIDDIMVAYDRANTTNGIRTGRVFVLYGNADSKASMVNLSTLDQNRKFTITGEKSEDQFGELVAKGGDINGDNIDDLLIAAPNKNNETGAVYVLFGKNDFNRTGLFSLNTLKVEDGFVIHGEKPNDRCCIPAHEPIDINGDGWDDIVLGTRYASSNR